MERSAPGLRRRLSAGLARGSRLRATLPGPRAARETPRAHEWRCLECGAAIAGALAELGAVHCHDCGNRPTVQRVSA